MGRAVTRHRLNAGSYKNIVSGAVTTPATGTAVAGQIFSPTSFWYADVRSAPVHSNSAALVSTMNTDRLAAYGGDVTLNTTAYAMPIWQADGTTPLSNVGFNNIQGKNVAGDTFVQNLMNPQWRNVPIPTAARPADGTDSEMGVYKASTGEYWEFWVDEYFATARGAGDRYYTNGSTTHNHFAAWGGRIQNCATSDGIFPHPYGTAATGLPFIGGQISIAEGEAAAAGDINAIKHALGLAIVSPRGGGQSWPANRNDGFSSNVNMPYEGQRFRVKNSVNVATMTGSNFQKAIVRACQVYGLVIWDKAGSYSLRAENPKTVTATGGTDPWPAIFGGVAQYRIGNTIPWDDLEALPFDYGKPA